MPDFINQPDNQPPPGGDQQRAESYIKQIIQLLTDNKLIATHTDLTKFDPNALQDHYRIDIKNYQLEISHSKQPATGKDIYVLLFINSPSVDDFYNAHGIIAYLVLNDDQFKRFKAIADEQIETRRKVEEEKRFAQAVKPIEELLEKIAKGEEAASQKLDTNSSTEVDQEKKVEPEPKKETVKVEPPPPEPKPEPKPEPEKPLPTLADVQEAMHQAAQESAPTSPVEVNVPTEEAPIQDHNLDIPQVVTLPSSEPDSAISAEIPPSPPPKLEPVVPPEPVPTFTPEQPSEPAPQPSQLSQQPVINSIPEGNVLTESTPTGSQALPPSGIDQAIDQAFQSSGNNSITSQTPPIGIN